MSRKPESRSEFDAYKDNYREVVDESVGFAGMSVDYFARVKVNYLLDIASAHFGDARSVSALDIGCGIGLSHKLLVPRLGELAGVDVSSGCIETARQENPDVNYKLYEGTVLPWEDGRFDLVFASCVMHHVEPRQWGSFVDEMFRVLTSNGLAVIFEHNPLNPLTRRIVDKCPLDENAVLLRANKTISLFTDAGFNGILSRKILTIPTWGRWGRRADNVLGMLPLGAQYYVKGVKP